MVLVTVIGSLASCRGLRAFEHKDAGVRPSDAHHEDLSSTMPERHTAAPATDQTTQQHPDTKPETEQEKKSWLDLSPIQVMGGALAAMTAAGLGSRFSVEGTIVGAALASVIAAVAGGLYTASLRRTSAAVRGVLSGRCTKRLGSVSVGSEAGAQWFHRGGPSDAVEPGGNRRFVRQAHRRRTVLLSSVVGAGAIFALAGGALTTYEAIAGQALSGGSGTTFSQVQEDGSEARPKDKKSPAPTETADPSESASRPQPRTPWIRLRPNRLPRPNPRENPQRNHR